MGTFNILIIVLCIIILIKKLTGETQKDNNIQNNELSKVENQNDTKDGE